MKYDKYTLPDDLIYNKDSSWIKVEGDIATIGIIEPIAKTLKEFLFIQLPEPKKIKAGEVYVSLETLKWSGHLTSSLSGTIIEINEDLYDKPDKINKNPYKEWIIKIKIDNKQELKELYTPENIIGWLEKIMK
ncbi:MAG: glycine cleavage system protein H [Minisyncoccales bacterium]